MERWAEYYQNLYSTENKISESVLANFPTLPVMEGLDRPPTEDDLSRAIILLAHGKAPGKDSIPAEVWETSVTKPSSQATLPAFGGEISIPRHVKYKHCYAF